MITRDGYRTTVEAGRSAVARLWYLLWASAHHAWAQRRSQAGP